MTKGALGEITHSPAIDLGPKGIRVNAVCAGKLAEVAEMIYFLVSDASSFYTGGHYLVDGGLAAK